MIPTQQPLKLYKNMDTFIAKFIWNDKSPHLSYKKLKLAKSSGGSGLPDV